MFMAPKSRATRITVSTLETPNAEQGYYDGDGKLVTPDTSEKVMWGEIMDKASLSQSVGGVIRDTGLLGVTVDTLSAKGIEIGNQLTTDRSSRKYTIVDIYEDEWRFSTVIVAKYIK